VGILWEDAKLKLEDSKEYYDLPRDDRKRLFNIHLSDLSRRLETKKESMRHLAAEPEVVVSADALKSSGAMGIEKENDHHHHHQSDHSGSSSSDEEEPEKKSKHAKKEKKHKKVLFLLLIIII
jgi:hypothetical protein